MKGFAVGSSAFEAGKLCAKHNHWSYRPPRETLMLKYQTRNSYTKYSFLSEKKIQAASEMQGMIKIWAGTATSPFNTAVRPIIALPLHRS